MPEYKLIDFTQLHKADIIFTTQRDSTISATIRAATNCAISHTMLVTRFNYIIDSTDIGVKERPWTEASEHCTLAIVMRRHSLLNAADQDKVVAAAKFFENRPYDKLGAAGSGMYGNSRNQILAGAGCTINLIACAFLLKEISDNAKDENADKNFFLLGIGFPRFYRSWLSDCQWQSNNDESADGIYFDKSQLCRTFN